MHLLQWHRAFSGRLPPCRPAYVHCTGLELLAAVLKTYRHGHIQCTEDPTYNTHAGTCAWCGECIRPESGQRAACQCPGFQPGLGYQQGRHHRRRDRSRCSCGPAGAGSSLPCGKAQAEVSAGQGLSSIRAWSGQAGLCLQGVPARMFGCSTLAGALLACSCRRRQLSMLEIL